MKKVFLSLAAALLIGIPNLARASVNGGATCAGCTVVLGLVEQTAQLNAIGVTNAISKVCGMLPSPYDWTCSTLISLYGPKLIKMLEDKYTPDVICNVIGVCNSSAGRTCNVFPKPKTLHGSRMSHDEFEQHIAEAKKKFDFSHVGQLDICDWLPQACQVADHKPFYDDDGDLFSPYNALRGHDWRGQDCDDSHNGIFPGRYDLDIGADNNCNGIYGVDPTTKVPYEKQWCDGTGQMGVAILGDSATAHFRIPPSYLTAANMSLATFSRLIQNLENELDFPMLSWSTGHRQTGDYHPDIDGPVDSIYLRMRENNLCNNNDYQNIGVNGADSSSMYNKLQYILSRDKNLSNLPQKPVLLFMAMIGNDVCNKQVTARVTPQEYHDNFLKTIQSLDTRLPKGSKVVTIGLVDGRILYDSMHDKIHPIGSTNGDVTYSHFYDYLNCMEMSPCAGWMNSNSTIRDNLSKQAADLTAQLPIIAEETRGKLKNIELFYLGDVINDAIKEFLAQGGQGWQMIEPADGFHPNQFGQQLFAQYIWNATVAAGVIPPANPHNDAIKSRFFPHEAKTTVIE